MMEVLDDGLRCMESLGTDFMHYPVCEYMMQSLFLRLTGYQEQKLKCIMWHLATWDFDVRYNLVGGRINIGEASNKDHKNLIYKHLVEGIKNSGAKFETPEIKDIQSQISNIALELTIRFGNSVFSRWLPREFEMFKKFTGMVKATEDGYFRSESSCFGKDSIIEQAHELAYNQRNRCAHNTWSYQRNTQSLQKLIADTRGADNYFSMIFILMLIDNVFVRTYHTFHTKVLHRSNRLYDK
ncbi:MAG: hypothetical protein J1F07_02130 [Muribaculaceae bacterium]|nr:hypothetical protein [Muribaculaceae bacterium]